MTKQSIHCVLLCALLAGSAFAQNFPRLEPDPKAVAFSNGINATGAYSWQELAEISLWASSANSAENGVMRIKNMSAELLASPDLPAAAREKAEFILGYMHKNALKTYSLHQTRMDTLLASKTYNCVSSAVMYMVLCQSAGLAVSGVMTKDHAFASVRIDGETIDVETTNPYGFDPGSRRDFHDQFGKVTGFAYVSPRNYRDRQAISPIELVSLILSNRIADLEAANRFAEAVPLAIDRAALLRNRPLAETNEPSAFFENPYRDLMNRLFNYGAWMLKSGKEEDCLRWAAFAAPRYPDAERWPEFVFAAVNNRMQKLIQAGQSGAARQFLESQKPALDAATYSRLDALLVDAELLAAASQIKNQAEGSRVIAAIDEARTSGKLESKRSIELLTFAIQKTAVAIAAPPKQDWLAAINFLEAAISRHGTSRELEQTLRNYRSNRVTDFHNRFATAWNKRDFAQAERVLTEALAEFPNERQLLADKQVFEKNR